MLKWILMGLTAILSACMTTGNTQAPLTFSNGHTPKFKVGDCVRIADQYVNELRSDGTPKLIIYIDSFETYTGDGGYVMRMIHPRIGHPTFHAFSTLSVDKVHVKTECPK